MNSSRWILGWTAVGVAAAIALAWVFPRAHPLYPRDWRISKVEAETIAVERLGDVGQLPDDPYVITILDANPVVEHGLQEDLRDHPERAAADSRLAREVIAWETQVYARDARASDWSHRARVSAQGEVLELRRRVPPEEEGGVIDSAEARRQADLFLAEQGFALVAYDEPELRTQQLQARTDSTLRYRDREGVLGEEVSSTSPIAMPSRTASSRSCCCSRPGYSSFCYCCRWSRFPLCGAITPARSASGEVSTSPPR
jgi:hypothetical protein